MLKTFVATALLIGLSGCIDMGDDIMGENPRIERDDQDRGASNPPRSGEPPMPVVITPVRMTPVPIPTPCPHSASVARANAGKPINALIDGWAGATQDDIDILERVRAGVSTPPETAYARNCLGLTTA